MDNSSIKKALLMQLMAELSKEEMKPFRGKDKEAESVVAIEVEGPEEEDDEDEACAPGSKADRMKKLKKLASE